MQQISLEEAKSHLSDLVAAALNGEEVFISGDQNSVIKLVPAAEPHLQAENVESLVEEADEIEVEKEIVVRMKPLARRAVKVRAKRLGQAKRMGLILGYFLDDPGVLKGFLRVPEMPRHPNGKDATTDPQIFAIHSREGTVFPWLIQCEHAFHMRLGSGKQPSAKQALGLRIMRRQ